MRRLWAIPALALWVVAVLYRCVVALEAPHDGKESWVVLGACLIVLGAYVAFRVWTLAADTEWQFGWRK